jgi:hypothetical protein
MKKPYIANYGRILNQDPQICRCSKEQTHFEKSFKPLLNNGGIGNGLEIDGTGRLLI